MRSIILFLSVFSFTLLFGQQDIHKDQTFKVNNLKTSLWDEFKFHIGLSLKFDVEFKIPIDDYNNDTYNISAILKDSLGNIVFNNESVNAVLYAKPSKKEGSKYIDRGLYLFISGTEFKLPRGNNKLQLTLNAQNGAIKFNAIYTGTIDVFVPNYYNYEDQEFYIKNYSVTEESVSGQRGIKIEFNTSYKFMSQQIKDFETNENSKHYFFYVEMKDEEGRTIYIPSEDIKKSFLTEYEKLHAKDKNTEDHVFLFISYRKLNLKPGQQNLKVVLNVTDQNKTSSFKNLATEKITISQPKLYFAELAVSGMTIKYGQYDMSSALGRLFSKKSKDKGKGYPDVLWRINTGYDEIYKTGINMNSFSAYDGSCFFKLAEKDPVQLVVEDNDNLINNDLIEKYSINNKEGECVITHQGLSYGEIENINIKFKKSNIPELINKIISVKESKRQNVTGYDFTIKYEVLNSNEKYPLEILPFYIDNKNSKSYIPYVKIINTDKLDKPEQVIISSEEPEGLINLFVPAYSLKNKCKLGYDVKIKDIQTSSYYNPDELNTTDVNDINFKIKDIKDVKQNSVYGVAVEVEYNIPIMYIYDIGYDRIYMTADFLTKNTNESLNRVIRKSMPPDPMTTGAKYFIPYYQIADYHEKLNIELNLIAKQKDMIIGRDTKDFSIPEAGMANILIHNFSLKYKTKSNFYTEMKIQILHDGKILGVTDKIPVENKMWFGNKIPMQKNVHPKDDIVIQLIGISKFESEEIIENWNIEAMRFADKKIKLAKKDEIKKLMINL